MKRVIKSASYGGAYDIEDDMFFTKEEIVEFADDVAEAFNSEHSATLSLSDCYIDTPNILHIEYTDDEGYEYSADVKIDMRKIRSPRDISKYSLPIRQQLKSQYDESREWENASSSSKIEGAVYGPDEPPESKFEEVDEFEEEFEIDLDGVKIAVDSYGAYEYLDEDGNIQDSDFKWAPDELVTEYYAVPVADNTEIIEYIDELLFPHIPDKPGEYTLSGTATLIFSISGVFENRDYYRDEDDDLVYDSEVSTDSVEVDFLEDKSSIDVTLTPSK